MLFRSQFLVIWVLVVGYFLDVIFLHGLFGHVDYNLGIFFPCDLSWNDELNYCVAKP